MTLRQLRYLCAIIEHGLNLSKAAEMLNVSQPGVSKQIQLLEEELGVVLFQRRRNRLLGLTAEGQDVHKHARRVLMEADNIAGIGREHSRDLTGRLIIATTHTQARYTLPLAIGRFVQRFPGIRLELWQGDRRAVFRRVAAGEADIAVGADPGAALEGVRLVRWGTLHYSIVAPTGHPILRHTRPPIETIAEYPIISHTIGSGRWKLSAAFEAAGLAPNIVFRAVNADVCKTYVEIGLGIAILASVAFDRTRDTYLRALPADHVFAPEPILAGVSEQRFHRRHIQEFLRLLAPDRPAGAFDPAGPQPAG